MNDVKPKNLPAVIAAKGASDRRGPSRRLLLGLGAA